MTLALIVTSVVLAVGLAIVANRQGSDREKMRNLEVRLGFAEREAMQSRSNVIRLSERLDLLSKTLGYDYVPSGNTTVPAKYEKVKK